LLAGRIAEADAVLEEMRAGSRRRHLPEGIFFCERLATQRRFLNGEFERADREWKALHAQAVRAGVSYAGMFYNAHTALLTFEREGPRAMLPRLLLATRTPTGLTPDMRASFARMLAETGEHELARAQLNAVGDPSCYPRDAHYLNLLALLALAACRVGDKSRCEQLFGLLEPYAEFNTPNALGYYLGSVCHFLGLLSESLGRSVRAGGYFERALERNRTMGYRPGVVRTLLAHGHLATKLGHRSLARELLTRAHADAQALGMRAAAEETEAAVSSARD
jgi:hypothetical protein